MGRQGSTVIGAFLLTVLWDNKYTMKPIFKYSPKDTYLILYALGVSIIPYVIATVNPDVKWWILTGFLHIWLLVNMQNSSLHHHTHWPIFVSPLLNRIYELFISSVSNIPNQIWKLAHTLHHKHVNDLPDPNGFTKDPVSVYKFGGGKPGEPDNFWVYCFKNAIYGDAKYCWFSCPITLVKFPELRKRYYRERWMFRLNILLIAMINWQYSIFLVLLYMIVFVVNNANSYGEHWGVLHNRGDTTKDSVGIYSAWYNWFGFNAGHHQEHHHRPGTHWTKLPTVTALLSPDRLIIKHGVHITNNPFWSHFILLFKKNGSTAFPIKKN